MRYVCAIKLSSKGKPVPVLKHYAMEAYGGVDVGIHIFLTSALVGGKLSASQLHSLKK
jgi:hypothetical protein